MLINLYRSDSAGEIFMTDLIPTINEINSPPPSSMLLQVPRELKEITASYFGHFHNAWIRQEQEIEYLTKHHPALMQKHKQLFQQNATPSLESFEARESILDKINGEIVTAKINLNETDLNLIDAHITRLPISLFQAKGYVDFWQNLTYLYCSNNRLTALNVQALAALQVLWCSNNQLISLNVQGLARLKELMCTNNQLTTLYVQELTQLKTLYCNDNQLTSLNVQGLMALQKLGCAHNQLTTLNVQRLMALQILGCANNQLTSLNVQGLARLQGLWCEKNPLKTLILTGVHADVKNEHAELERSLLFQQLGQADSSEVRQGIIARLGADYTYENCLKYCPAYAEKLFAFDSANGVYDFTSAALTQASTFLPSFGVNNNSDNLDLREKRDKNEMQLDGVSEESDGEPEFKRACKS